MFAHCHDFLAWTIDEEKTVAAGSRKPFDEMLLRDKDISLQHRSFDRSNNHHAKCDAAFVAIFNGVANLLLHGPLKRVGIDNAGHISVSKRRPRLVALGAKA